MSLNVAALAEKFGCRCPKCHKSHKNESTQVAFGFRRVPVYKAGKVVSRRKIRQSWCRRCRS